MKKHLVVLMAASLIACSTKFESDDDADADGGTDTVDADGGFDPDAQPDELPVDPADAEDTAQEDLVTDVPAEDTDDEEEPVCLDFFLDLDGEDDYVRISDNPALELAGSATFELWVNLDDPAAGQRIFEKWGVLPGNREYYVIVEDGAVHCHGSDTQATTLNSFDVSFTTSLIRAGEWNHIACVLDTSAGQARIYLNGALYDSDDTDLVFEDSNGDLWIGSSQLPTTVNMGGLVSEFRIWSTARTADEITETMSCRLTGTEAGLQAYFPLNDGAGVQVLDAVAGLTGTVFDGDVQRADWREADLPACSPCPLP